MNITIEHANALADQAWQCDRAVWVGEWHTHPGGQLRPSARDVATYVELLADADLEFTAFASIIVVPDPSWMEPHLIPWVIAMAPSHSQLNMDKP